MKKQILILVMALFAIGVQQVSAQYLQPTPLGDCIDLEDPLNVAPGHEYTYSVNVPTPPGPHTYHWFVTQDIEFIQNGGLIADPELIGTSAILASGPIHYNDPTLGANSITLTWNSFILNPGQYVFVGIFVEDVDGCSNNLKVYRIRPLHAFTLDLANVDNTGATPDLAIDGFEQCVSVIESAVFDPNYPTPDGEGGIVYNFGRDSLYYVVAAANFSTGYQLQYIFAGLQGATPDGSLPQTASIAWSYTMAGLETATTQPITDGAIGTLVGIVQAQDAPVGEDGEMIYIKVLILHNHYELTTDTPYSLAIDGVLTDAAWNVLDPDLYADLHHGDCDFDGFDNDVTEQVLTARPTIESATGDPAGSSEFLPIAP